jgi:hypothetical protein
MDSEGEQRRLGYRVVVLEQAVSVKEMSVKEMSVKEMF